MLPDTPAARTLIADFSRAVVLETAPEELDLFDELIEDYFSSPLPARHSPGEGPGVRPGPGGEADDPLGFGLSETIAAVTPAAAAMASAVLGYLLTETVKATQEESAAALKKKIKALFNPETQPGGKSEPAKQEANLPLPVIGAPAGPKPDEDPAPLTVEQLQQVKRLARKQAVQFGLEPDLADKMAIALVGALALA